MSKIIVIVDTDHTDDDEAIKSVSNGLKRAGYIYKDHETGSFALAANNTGLIITSRSHGLLQFQEPEVADRA